MALTKGLTRSPGGIRRVRIAETLPEDDYDPIIDQLNALLDELPDPAVLTAAQTTSTIHHLQQVTNRLDAYRDHLSAAAEDAGYSRDLHAGTTGVMVGIAANQDTAVGSASVRRGQWLKNHPVIDAAYSTGRVSRAHVEHLRKDCDRIDWFTETSTDLVVIAANTDPSDLCFVLAQLVDASAPEAPDKDYEKSRRRRFLQTSRQRGGELEIRARLDPVNAEIFLDAMAPGLKNTEAGNTIDARSKDQSGLDVFMDLVQRGAATNRPSGVSSVTILVDAEHIADGHGARFDDGTPIPAAAYQRYTCTPILTLLTGYRIGGTFVPLDCHRDYRRATAGQWRALIARDHGCVRCGRPPRHTQAHHIIGWAAGGLTDLENLALLCESCHNDCHAGLFTITMTNHIPVVTEHHRGPPRP